MTDDYRLSAFRHDLFEPPTYSMEQSLSWEANLSYARNPAHCLEPESSLPRYNSPPSVPVLSQIQSIPPPPPSHFLKIHLYIILPSTPGSSMWPLILRFPYQKPVCTSRVPPIRTTRSTHLILDSITRILLGDAYTPVSSSLCMFLHSPVDEPLTASLNKLCINTVCRTAFSVQSTGGMPAEWGSAPRSKTLVRSLTFDRIVDRNVWYQ